MAEDRCEECRRLREEVYILSGEITALKRSLDELRRRMPLPEQLGEAVEAARVLRRLMEVGRR